ncbi:hypothetical protein ACWKWU_10715 [Chitinophaga lutea]
MKPLLLGMLSLTLFAACSKKNNPAPVPSDGETPPPVTRPVGQSAGAPVVKTIGPEGGQLVAGPLRITVPAGAVAGATEFTAQSIQNTCDAAAGASFSLLPHGTVFSKPVTLTFSYGPSAHPLPDPLGIAYQDAQGYWRLAKNAVVDKELRTVSVQTTHFSNWALIQWLQISPPAAVLGTGASQALEVKTYLPLNDDLLTPIVPADGTDPFVGEGRAISGQLVQSWTVGGVGTVTGSGAKATYKAPSAIDRLETAAVTASIKSDKHQLLLVSNITIIPEGITYRVNDGPWEFLPGMGGQGNGNFNIGGIHGSRSIAVDWKGGAGSFPWSEDREVALIYSNGNGQYIESVYFDKAEGRFIDAGGAFNVLNFGAKGEFITGSFTMTDGGVFTNDDHDPVAKAAISGYFYVKRGF